jgi:hypothetical protein
MILAECIQMQNKIIFGFYNGVTQKYKWPN